MRHTNSKKATHKLALATTNETVRSTKSTIHLGTTNLQSCFGIGIVGTKGRSLTHISAAPIFTQHMDYAFGREKDIESLFHREAEFVGNILRIEIVANQSYNTDPTMVISRFLIGLIRGIAEKFSNNVSILFTDDGKYELNSSATSENKVVYKIIKRDTTHQNYSLYADVLRRIIKDQALPRIACINDEIQPFEIDAEIVSFIKLVTEDATYLIKVAENLVFNYPEACNAKLIEMVIKRRVEFTLQTFNDEMRIESPLINHKVHCTLVMKGAPEVAALNNLLQLEFYAGYQAGKLGIVDALINMSKIEDPQQIILQLDQLHIPYAVQTKVDKQYLIIPGVNTPHVVKAIQAAKQQDEKTTDGKSELVTQPQTNTTTAPAVVSEAPNNISWQERVLNSPEPVKGVRLHLG